MKGVDIYDLKKITVENGNIFHALKSTDLGYVDFGEAYFSQIKYKSVKGWKRHNEFTLNIIVPLGKIRFVIYDDRVDSETFEMFFEISLSPDDNYKRLTVAPGLWMAFQGLGDGLSMLLDIIPSPHISSESDTLPIQNLNFNFDL